MKNFLCTFVLSLSLTTPISAFAFLGMNAGANLQGAAPAWTKQLGARSIKGYLAGDAVATDPSQNIIIAGATNGDIDGNKVTGYDDLFVVKYDSSGTKLWSRELGTASVYVTVYGLATDSSGNIFVAGSVEGGFDGNTPTGNDDPFVTKYSASGTKLWTRQIGVASHTAEAYAVATDSSGNVILAGYTDGGLDGNTQAGGDDFFVIKYDASGTKLWTRQLGVSSQETLATGVATDSSGNVFVAGYTYGGLDGNSLMGSTDFFVTKYNSSGTKIWTKQLGVSGAMTQANSVATDSSGNIFVTGDTVGGLDGNAKLGSQDTFVTKYDSTGTKIWTTQIGISGGTYAVAHSIVIDPLGNIILAGMTSGGLEGNTLTGANDLFVTQRDSTGAKIWTKQLGIASQNTDADSVAVDSSGNIFVAGFTDGGLDGNTLTGIDDIFVSKYDSSGTRTWTKQLGGLAPVTIDPAVAAVDALGNLYVAGATDGGLDGNSQSGGKDFFVTKYNSSGTKIWTRQLGNLAWTVAYGAATDSSGNVFVAGLTQDGLDGNTFGGDEDFFVTKYDSSGTKLWTKELGAASGWSEAYGVATDSSGNVFVAGGTSANLDGNTLAGSEDFFVTKYDSSGTKLWTRQLGVAPQDTWANAVTTDSSGNIYVAGSTHGGLDGNTLTGTTDFFVTKYDSNGTKIWTKQLGVASHDTWADAVATDSSGNVFVASGTTGGLDGNTLTGTQDFFVTKYDSSGTKLWTRQLGVASKATWAKAVATDASGNVFVAGPTRGGLDGNTLRGTTDFFVTKFTSAGVKQWTKQMGSPSADTYAYSVAIDSSGRLYVAGTTKGGLDFNSLIGIQDAFACQYIGN